MKKRVVITGMGAISPIGNTAVESWNNAKLGVNGIDLITKYDTSSQKAKLAGEIKDYHPEQYFDKKEIKKYDTFTQYAVIASREAMEQSKLDINKTDASRSGVIISSGIGGLDMIEEMHSRGLAKGFDRVSPFFIPMSISNMAAATVAIEHGLKGMCTCVVTACAGGTNAIGDGFRQIRDGYADVMLCGGTESCITPLGMGGFTTLKALNETDNKDRASIPFDAERNGFIMGEGAAVLVLEEYEHAIARNAHILGELIGYGANCDAHHMTAPKEDGSGAAACMILAMEDAKISIEDVDYINAHGTSTPLNDKCETLAVKTVFKEAAKDLLMSSTKSMTGHLLGAAGALESVFCIGALQDQIAPPTINYQVPDEACDLNIIPNQAVQADIQIALSNSLGFGGHNATLIFKKY